MEDKTSHKSAHKPCTLNVSTHGNQRVFVGLGWDPNDHPPLMDRIGSLFNGKDLYHDMDLSCHFYNAEHQALGFVSADKTYQQNQNGSIYHSGDDIEGIGDGDDEQISLELSNLPANIHSVIFSVSIKSGHVFDEIDNPHIRLCDGYTGRVFIEHSMRDHADSATKNHDYAFLVLMRDADSWRYQTLNTFIPSGRNRDTEEEISERLSKLL